MSTENFKFTEDQEKWLQFLESGEYNQIKGKLKVKQNDEFCYCCLGIAEEFIGDFESKPVTLINSNFDGIIHHFNGVTMSISHKTKIKLNLINDTLLMKMNDEQGLTFKEIAAEIRKNPTKFFTQGAKND